MLEVGEFDAKDIFGTLLDRVEGGEEVLITRHGRPVARLVPNIGVIDRAQAAAAVKSVQSRSSQLAENFDWPDLMQSRDAGRP